MKCKSCGGKMEVIDSRKADNCIRRRRKCANCDVETRTVEVVGDAASSVDGILRDRRERDRAVGALCILVYDGVISAGRMRELMDMDICQQRKEIHRVVGG